MVLNKRNYPPVPQQLLVIEEEKEDEDELNESSRPQIAHPLIMHKETSGDKSGKLGSRPLP